MGQETDPGPSCSMAWVDVRDLADAHALALEKEEAGGNRIIVASGPYKWQDWRAYYWICLFRRNTEPVFSQRGAGCGRPCAARGRVLRPCEGRAHAELRQLEEH